MDGEILTWIFLIGGILLMALETLIPSGAALTLGFSGVVVGLLRFLGLLASPGSAAAAWLVISVGLILIIRPLANKYFGDNTFYKYADEDYEAMDQIVEAVETINELDNSGRIRFQGISWQARSIDGSIPAGSKVRIKYRDNTTWIVEAVDAAEPEDRQKLKE